MKKTIRVTIEKEITVDIPDNMLTPEFRAEFEKGLHEYRNDDHLFYYAAEQIAMYGEGEIEGLGYVGWDWTTFPKVPDVKFDIGYEDTESVLINDTAAKQGSAE